jgi:hypothetical protein
VLFHGYMTTENIDIRSLHNETVGEIFSYFILQMPYSFHHYVGDFCFQLPPPSNAEFKSSWIIITRRINGFPKFLGDPT